MKLLYIAGPYRAATHYQTSLNIELARRAAALFWSRGFAVICPHTNSAFMSGAAPEENFCEGTMEMLRRCDGVVVLPGWPGSEGTKAEIFEAARLGIRVCYLGDPAEWATTVAAACEELA